MPNATYILGNSIRVRKQSAMRLDNIRSGLGILKL